MYQFLIYVSKLLTVFVNIRLDIEGYLRFVLRAPPHHLRDDVYWHGEHDGRVVLLGDVVQGLGVAELKRNYC